MAAVFDPARVKALRLDEIRWNDKDASTIIGTGSFGIVYSGKAAAVSGDRRRCAQPELEVAVKVLMRVPSRIEEQQGFLREVEIGKKVQHPAILRILASSNTPRQWKMVTLRARSDIRKIFESKARGQNVSWTRADGTDVEWNATKRAICVMGIAAGLCYLHDREWIHRDMKPENVLLDENMYPLIADLGFARHRGGIAFVSGNHTFWVFDAVSYSFTALASRGVSVRT